MEHTKGPPWELKHDIIRVGGREIKINLKHDFRLMSSLKVTWGQKPRNSKTRGATVN